MKTVLKAVALLAIVAGTASADIAGEAPLGMASAYNVDYVTGAVVDSPINRYVGTVYSNTGGTANAAISSTALNSIWGDEMTTVGTGTLDSMAFTVFNSGSSGGVLASAVVTVNFFRAGDSSFVGGFSIAPFAFNLSQGFFTVLTVSNLSGLGINLDTTGLIVTQQASSVVGATRIGVAMMQPVAIGASGPTMYINSSTIGPAGFYNLTSGGVPIDADVGYRMDTIPAPGAAALLGLGGLVATRRRR